MGRTDARIKCIALLDGALHFWNATGFPLLADKTNVVIVTATATSWAPAFGGNTTFNDTLTVVCMPITLTLERKAEFFRVSGQ